jgi:hypothetical protein
MHIKINKVKVHSCEADLDDILSHRPFGKAASKTTNRNGTKQRESTKRGAEIDKLFIAINKQI